MTLLEIPLNPGVDEARRWLEEILAAPEYQSRRNLLEELLDYLKALWQTDISAPAHIGSKIALVIGLVLLGLLGWWLVRSRRTHTLKATTDASPLIDRKISPDEYRSRALQALAAGDPDTALMDAFRAIVADLDRRAVLGNQPGKTAYEVSVQVAQAFPDVAQRIRLAAKWFGMAAYGVAPAPRTDPAHASDVLDLGQHVAASRPVLEGLG